MNSLDALRKHCEKDFEGLWPCFLELLGGRDLSENGEGCERVDGCGSGEDAGEDAEIPRVSIL